jgi:GABA(A) receptor-associated protein
MSSASFKNSLSLAERKHQACRIREKYPNRIPVICEKAANSDVPDVDKKKYLVPHDLSVGQFLYVIRKRIQLPSSMAIYLFVNNTIPPTSLMMLMLYEQHADEDGFLYMSYSGENTFG